MAYAIDMQMELRHLRYFVAVAEEGHITRAAERLGLQQPPLSQQIKALETELDSRLFVRKPRGVELTQAGQALLVEARAILSRVEQAAAATRRAARGEQGRIAVGFTSSVPFHPFMPRVIRGFRESAPLISLILEEGGTTELVDALRQERLDAAFIRSPVADPQDIVVRPLLEEGMVAALPADHALARKDAPIALPALAGEPFILYRRPSGPGLYDAILAACHRAGFSPRIGQEAPRMLSTLNLVGAGLGVSIVPESMRRLHMDGVVFSRLKDRPPLKAPLHFAHRREEKSPVVQRFIDLVVATAAKPRRIR
jgi:DNA-binding transcriptional LysR family regulator